MTVKEMVANTLYQRYCEAQGMYALTWDDLPGHRKHVWMAVAETALGVRIETIREVRPWQTRPRTVTTERRIA